MEAGKGQRHRKFTGFVLLSQKAHIIIEVLPLQKV